MAASRVASGILVSRAFGLVREITFAHHFGNGPLADAWRAALKIPNVIQNLLGEGSLSASFIPVYVRFLEEGREEEAGRAAGAVLGLLATAAGALALIGSWAAPLLVAVFTIGFTGDGRAEILVTLLRVLFPMTGVLVISAWALGVLNSRRRFFISYVAPALWNLSMIVTMVTLGGRGVAGVELLVALAWGALAGGVLQLLFQLPFLARYLRHARPSLNTRIAGVREIMTNFVPAMAARGAVNLGALLDTNLASLLVVGAVGALGYAQTLYLLPVSLFGLSIAAAELPELSRDRASGMTAVRKRAEQAVGKVLFWMIPVTGGYIFHREAVTAIFQRGAFDQGQVTAVGLILAAYALGLPAAGTARVLSSTFFALGDTRTPARIAFARIAVSAGVGVALMFPLDRHVVGGLGMGAAGLAGGSAAGSWLELLLLRRKLGRRLPGLALADGRVARCLFAAIVATAAGMLPGLLLPPLAPLLRAAVTILPVALLYLGITRALGVSPVRLRSPFRRG